MSTITGKVSVYVYQLIRLKDDKVRLGIFLNGKLIEYYPNVHKKFAERVITNKKLGVRHDNTTS